MQFGVVGESQTFLVDQIFDDPEKAVKKHFKMIFETALEGICIDENEWPKKLMFKLFNEWFDYSISDWVFDLSRQPIIDHLD